MRISSLRLRTGRRGFRRERTETQISLLPNLVFFVLHEIDIHAVFSTFNLPSRAGADATKARTSLGLPTLFLHALPEFELCFEPVILSRVSKSSTTALLTMYYVVSLKHSVHTCTRKYMLVYNKIQYFAITRLSDVVMNH